MRCSFSTSFAGCTCIFFLWNLFSSLYTCWINHVTQETVPVFSFYFCEWGLLFSLITLDFATPVCCWRNACLVIGITLTVSMNVLSFVWKYITGIDTFGFLTLRRLSANGKKNVGGFIFHLMIWLPSFPCGLLVYGKIFMSCSCWWSYGSISEWYRAKMHILLQRGLRRKEFTFDAGNFASVHTDFGCCHWRHFVILLFLFTSIVEKWVVGNEKHT